MAMVNAFAAFRLRSGAEPFSHYSFPRYSSATLKPSKLPAAVFNTVGRNRIPAIGGGPCFSLDDKHSSRHLVQVLEAEHGEGDVEDEELELEVARVEETIMYSFSPLPLLLLGALPGASTVRSLFGPFAELVKSFNLPGWLVHWGHPGNMAVVLFAMGGYGTYLGFRIKYSDDVEEKAKAKDLHPKLLAGMFFFFALGATGGVTSLLTSDRPIFESPHAVTGLIGLALLTIQTILPSTFEENPGLRNVHGILGSGIMTLFLIHAAFGLQLGLSY